MKRSLEKRIGSSLKRLLAASLPIALAQGAFADSVKRCPPRTVCQETLPFESGLAMDASCSLASYNASAAIDAPFFGSASFIYWLTSQGGMLIATPRPSSTPLSGGPALGRPQGKPGLFADNEFKPGFKVGLGAKVHEDGWTLFGGYTRLHGTTDTFDTAPSPVITPGGINLGVYLQEHFPVTNNTSTQAGLKWTYNIDFADLQMARPYYSGTHLILEPFAGLRGALILQKARAVMQGIRYPAFISQSQEFSHFRSRGIGIGPKIGINGGWHVKEGIRLNANGYGSILFTRYTKISQDVDNVDRITDPADARAQSFKSTDVDTVRPMAGALLGLGWGRYLEENLYIDVAADYEFHVFWSQNMLFSARTDLPLGDLYLHGLTISAKVDF